MSLSMKKLWAFTLGEHLGLGLFIGHVLYFPISHETWTTFFFFAHNNITAIYFSLSQTLDYSMILWADTVNVS